MIFCPMMADDLAVRCKLTPVSKMQDRWRRDALLMLAELNRLRASDIHIQCGFVGDRIAIGSMYRWQPDLRIQEIGAFIKDADEAIQYLRQQRAAEEFA